MITFRELFQGRKETDQIPKGEFRAPLYRLDKRENHGNDKGYHIHILKLISGRYLRTNAALTRRGNEIYLFFIGKKMQ
jgi:hypothetical protein